MTGTPGAPAVRRFDRPVGARATTRRRARAALTALALGALSGCDARRPEAQALVRGQRLDRAGAVRVWNLVGSVRVVGWARDSVAVTARVGGGGQLFFGGGIGGVKVGVESPRGSLVDSASGALELRVPRGARVWVKTASATVDVSGLAADVEVYSVSGAVRVAGRPAALRVESLDGAVTLDGGAAWLRARTSSGAVRVRGPLGDAGVATVGGEVRVEGDVAQRARVETVTGAVRYAGVVAQGAELAVDTHAGDVTLALAGPRPALDLASVRGRVVGGRTAGASAAGGRVAAPAAPGAGRVEVRSFRGAITAGGPER